ncbi:MAG: hypothetical protein WBB01_03240 [Phormidesmis sp.]
MPRSAGILLQWTLVPAEQQRPIGSSTGNTLGNGVAYLPMRAAVKLPSMIRQFSSWLS